MQGAIRVEETIEVNTDNPLYDDFLAEAFAKAALVDDMHFALGAARKKIAALEVQVKKWSDMYLELQAERRDNADNNG